jgi:hypothetical protein
MKQFYTAYLYPLNMLFTWFYILSQVYKVLNFYVTEAQVK